MSDWQPALVSHHEPYFLSANCQLRRGARLLQKKLGVPMVASMAIGRAREVHATNDETLLGLRFRVVPMGGSSHGQYKHRGKRHPYGSDHQKHRDHSGASSTISAPTISL